MTASRTCPACGAPEAEITATGHRRLGGRACHQACVCLPQHLSLDEHAVEGELAATLSDREVRACAVVELKEYADECEATIMLMKRRAAAARVAAACLLAAGRRGAP